MSNIISFFQKLIKGGVGIRVGGLENFSKINKRGGDDYSVLESTPYARVCSAQRFFREWMHGVPSHKALRSCEYFLLLCFCRSVDFAFFGEVKSGIFPYFINNNAANARKSLIYSRFTAKLLGEDKFISFAYFSCEVWFCSG